MTLERVGSGAGPDLETLAQVHRQAPGTTLIGAGGVRSVADLERTQAVGAGAWLVASALHDLQLPRRPR
jgi:phosphoribosylformimino-5-aminoimidazole carboxamide ribotide isomerase